MRLIKEEYEEQQSIWEIYVYQQKHWIKEITIYNWSRNDICQLIGAMKIEYMMIDITSRNIEWLYNRGFPIQMIINPCSWQQMAKVLQEGKEQWQEEVAITLENQIREEKEGISLFFRRFYRAASCEMAYEIYEQWQSNRLLCYDLGNKIIDLFQTYEDEVFNYFKLPMRKLLFYKKGHP